MPRVDGNTTPQMITHNNALGANEAQATINTGHSSSALEAFDAKHPNLATELRDAKLDLEKKEQKATWSGLKWYEKAVFFMLPFGGLMGADMMKDYRHAAEKAGDKVQELESLMTQRSKLEASENGRDVDGMDPVIHRHFEPTSIGRTR